MHDLPLVTTIAAGFAAAWVFGLLSQRIGLSPIVGYLLAGILIGPHTPGYTGDVHIAQQLAEVGVILLMFGVGLHFHPKDLLAVKNVAIPGAVGQSVIATLVAIVLFHFLGLSLSAGAVIGMAMAVASTVVLMRVLMDAGILSSPQGHVAVGWLIVEDIFTVIVLVIIPVLGAAAVDPAAAAALTEAAHGVADKVGAALPAAADAAKTAIDTTHAAPDAAHAPAAAGNLWLSLGLALLKLGIFVALVWIVGARAVPWMMVRVARLRSRELFTLTVLVFSVAVAAGAYMLFGASMALGAFLAGMMVAQSPVSSQAAADALPLRDAFAVLFFVSVGMLFDPRFLIDEPLMVLAGLFVVLIVKPAVALAIVAFLGRSPRTGLTVAIGLAQIGEFSFIVSESARKVGIMPDSGHNVLVATAILSITVNPLLFRALGPMETFLRRRPVLWKILNARAEKNLAGINDEAEAKLKADSAAADTSRLAVIVGFGPVGVAVDQIVRESGMRTVIIDLNADTVIDLNKQNRPAIFGDASSSAVLEQASLEHASHLVITLPHAADRAAVVAAARESNPNLRILVRARYLREQADLAQAGATAAIFEEGEAAVALARLVLSDTGADGGAIGRATHRLRREFRGTVMF